MLKWFKCPKQHGKLIETEKCLEMCEVGQRCLTKPTLAMAAEQRVWAGKPSTTQLIDGTMMVFLKLTKDYAIDPRDNAFAMLGTRHHRQMEDVAKELGIPAEIKLTGEISGICDLLEAEHGEVILSDLKTWGAFRVQKALGMVKVGKGQWECRPETADLLDVELQLNQYRVMVESQLGIHVDRMQVQITVRDGGLIAANSYGITENMYLLPVRMYPDDEVKMYFDTKAQALAQALEQGSWDKLCSSHESWNGKRCTGYCEVRAWCPRI